jgi:hypothetical protein
MSAPRSTVEYDEGVSNFIEFAIEKAGMVHRLLCPCNQCVNRYWLVHSQVREHLVCHGFMTGYSTWLFHGEDFEHNEPEEESETEYADHDEIDSMLLEGYGMYDTATVGSEEDEDDDQADEEVELQFDAETYRKLVLDGSSELYTGCKKFSKLQFLVKLLNIKNIWGIPNGCFDAFLSLIKEALPEGQDLPNNFHASRKYIKDVGVGYESIHACKHDCIMYRGRYSQAEQCPVCKTSRWKSIKTGIDGKRVYKTPEKVIRHFKLKHRVRRLFLSSKTSPDMVWHSTGRTKDGLLRHPADSPAWKSFDEQHQWFSAEPRNIRFALATDGFNPFKSKNISYSIWPIVLIPYNLPPWICMKQSNFILNVIVPGRKSPGKEMDVYMQLTIEDLQEFWKPGVWTYDVVVGKKFELHAALLWTISDWLGRGCLSGESLNICSHCLTNTCRRYLKHGKKMSYMGHRRFLDEDHEFRYDEDSFNGKPEHRGPPIQPTGLEISEMTAAVHTDYGKLQKQQRGKRRKKVEQKLRRKMMCTYTVWSVHSKREVCSSN